MPYIMHCPRCDKPYTSNKSKDDALEKVKEHVSNQHPDYDPDWHDTYPESFGN